jgi:integrase
LPGQPGEPAFIAAYEAAHRTRRQPAPGTLHSAIADYKASRDFQDLAPRTRKDYLRHIANIEQVFASLPLAAFDSPKIFRVFLKWRDGLPGGACQADYAFRVLMRICSWTREQGLIDWRPPARIKPLYHADRAERVWMAEQIAAFRAVCSDELWRAMVLALETGQRQGDLLLLPWSAYGDGSWITLRQNKGGRRVQIPVTQDLRTVLAGVKRVSPVILTNSRGRPWTADGFRTSWWKASKAAGIEDLTFHDLRGTAVLRLAEAGCTNPEIAAITGHSFKSVEVILERYLPRSRGLALSAIAKLERGKK